MKWSAPASVQASLISLWLANLLNETVSCFLIKWLNRKRSKEAFGLLAYVWRCTIAHQCTQDQQGSNDSLSYATRSFSVVIAGKGMMKTLIFIPLRENMWDIWPVTMNTNQAGVNVGHQSSQTSNARKKKKKMAPLFLVADNRMNVNVVCGLSDWVKCMYVCKSGDVLVKHTGK